MSQINAPVSAAAASATKQIPLYTPQFYAYCGIGGALCCGLTHAMMTPVDLIKCRIQTGYPYKSFFHGFSTAIRTEGLASITTGWAPTLIGYSAQGFCKYGFYEYFKKLYSDLAGDEAAYKYRTFLYMGASASAEVIADVALAPWEAVKVRVQTSEGYAKGLMDGMPKMVKTEGLGTLYKGLVPLWGRQVPYTIMKFTAFESTVEAIYKYCLSKPKSEYSTLQQLGVTFVAGYFAGIFCALVSHPSDVIVSKLNKSAEKSVGQLVSELGWKGMWTGLGPRIFMVGTLTAIQWFIYDSFKAYVGLPTSGGSKAGKPVDTLASPVSGTKKELS